MAKFKKTCPICGKIYTGKKCKSKECALFKMIKPQVIRSWQICNGVALLAGLVGTAIQTQGIMDNDKAIADRGDKVVRWSLEGIQMARVFGVPASYREKQEPLFNANLNSIWPKDEPPHALRATDTVLSLIHDTIERFAPMFSPQEMRCWNYLEYHFTQFIEASDADILDHANQINADYLAFHRFFWDEKETAKRKLKMYEVGRMTVAAYSKGEARELVRLNSGLINQPVKHLVDTAKVNYNGKDTPCGMLLELFDAPGLIATIKEAA